MWRWRRRDCTAAEGAARCRLARFLVQRHLKVDLHFGNSVPTSFSTANRRFASMRFSLSLLLLILGFVAWIIAMAGCVSGTHVRHSVQPPAVCGPLPPIMTLLPLLDC